MRNPNRIPRITAKLAALWVKQPDMRLGQLCDCIVLVGDPQSIKNSGEHNWNTEDDVFETALDIYAAKNHVYIWPKSHD